MTAYVQNNDIGDFSLYHQCRNSSFIQNLEAVGAFSSVGISPQNFELELVDCDTSDSESESGSDFLVISWYNSEEKEGNSTL